MPVSEATVRAYLYSVANGPRGEFPEYRETLAAIGDVNEVGSVVEDARFIAAVRDGGEPALAHELANERAANYSGEARETATQIVDTVLADPAGGVRTAPTRADRERVAALDSHPAHEILALVADGRPVPGVDRLLSFGLERATAQATNRAARIITALVGGGRNPRATARHLAQQIATEHPLPAPDPWADFGAADA
jgi:hypothetical protein